MLAEIVMVTKKVRVPNVNGMVGADGKKWHYEFIRVPKSVKEKTYKNPKWTDKLVPNTKKNKKGKKNKSKSTIKSVDWYKMELDKKRRDLQTECKRIPCEVCTKKRKDLQAEIEDYYRKYPQKRPKNRKPTIAGPVRTECSSKKYSDCEMIIWTYPNGNKKIITTQKVPKKPKQSKTQSKGVADYGCNCYI